jgi:hypothetical protein
MTMKPTLHRIATPALALLGAAMLAGCSESPEKTFETRTEDKSGGEFIVTEMDREGVEVELPKTEMTPVAPGDGRTGPVPGSETMEQGD